MKLEFEKWIDETASFSSKGSILIEEAVRCYKVGAYRGAYLFSYLAFKMTIKDRILASSYLNNKGAWSNDIRNLDVDSKWEICLDSLIFKKIDDSTVFSLDGDMQKEYDFWRKKRNDCAHAKDEIFDNSTVEMFWNFIKKNIVKFQVMGSEPYLVNSLFEHFKYNRSEKELYELISQLSTLNKGEIVRILEQFDKEVSDYFHLGDDIENLEALKEFWLTIKSDIKINDAFFEFVCSKGYRFFDKFYKFIPDILSQTFEFNKTFVERKILEVIYTNKYSDIRLWHYTVKILELFSPSEASQLIDKIIRTDAPRSQPNELESRVLKQYGYYEKWKKQIFDGNLVNKRREGVDYIYNNSNNIFAVLEHVEWDESIYKCLNNIFEWDSRTHGRIDGEYKYYAFIEFRSEFRSGRYKEKYDQLKSLYEVDQEGKYIV